MKIIDFYLKTYQGEANLEASDIRYVSPLAPVAISSIEPRFADVDGFCFPLVDKASVSLERQFLDAIGNAIRYFLDRGLTVERIPILIGSSVLPNQIRLEEFKHKLMSYLVCEDIEICFVSTACTSGASALRAFELSKHDEGIVIAADFFSDITISGFNSIGAFSSIKPRPFSEEADGMGLGDAVAAVYVTKAKVDREPIFEVLSVDLCAETYHVTTPDPEAKLASEMITRALTVLSGQGPITWCLHATGTKSNDHSERSLVEAVQQKSCGRQIEFVEFKSLFGHTLGACPLVELCALMDQGLRQLKESDLWLFGSSGPVSNAILNSNLAFGGHNSVIAGVFHDRN